MNRKALYFGIAYSLTAIIFKLIILLGGYSLTNFGFFFTHITSVLLIIPFYVFAIKNVRDNDYGGIIGGREAARVSLTIFAVGVIIVSIYNYIEFANWGPNLAIEYYNGPRFMAFLKSHPEVKPSEYASKIKEQIDASGVSAAKATTAKLFSYMFIGLSGAFITSAIMKRSPK